jgi:RNA polymerase sigma factor (sigma-70 family)
LRHLAGSERAQQASDAELLRRFLTGQEEDAFAALLRRHSRLVWSVCWQVLGQEQDAEDAFQATFLALIQNAASIRQGQAIASWLYHVAGRVARKAAAQRVKRHAHERQAQVMPHPAQGTELAWRELQGILDEELQRLPEKYRAPFLLCCLEGHSKAEAAQQLGWKEGTVSSRLVQARKFLQQRLTRRGVSFSAAVCCLQLNRAGAVSPPLIKCTIRAASCFAAGKAVAADLVSAEVAALSKGASQAMSLPKLKIATLFLAVSVLIGAGWLTRQSLAEKPLGGQQQAVLRKAPQAVDAKEPGGETVVIKGRVLDPEGKPLEGAKLYLSSKDPTAAARATSGTEGRFEFSCTKATLAAASLQGQPAQVMAVAKGYGCDWVAIDPNKKDGTLKLQLVKDAPINFRVLDQDGEPIVGAKASLTNWIPWHKHTWLSAVPGHDVIKDVIEPWQNRQRQTAPQKDWSGPLPGQPEVVTAGADGRIRLTGLGKDCFVGLHLEGPRMLPDKIIVLTRPGKPIKLDVGLVVHGTAFDYVAHPARPIRGVVRDKASGKPVAGVVVSAKVKALYFTIDGQLLETHTDRDGRYDLHGYPKSENYRLSFDPPSGRHFAVTAEVADTKGFDPLTLDVELLVGISLRGRVTDKSTGKPIPQARVRYQAAFPNPHSRKVPGFRHSETITGADGTFTLVVFQGPGLLGVTSPRRELYLPAFVSVADAKRVFGKDWNPGRVSGIEGDPFPVEIRGQPGLLFPKDYDALVLLPVDEKAKSLKRDVALLRRGYEP